MPDKQKVILVDENDNPIGSEEKLVAHQQGLLHRAFSVFVFYQHDDEREPELLLQQRQTDKYHSGGMWTNTCCSHPRPDEQTIAAGERRLFEEMGIKLTLQEMGGFHYIAEFDNGLTENELDHVLIGFAENKDVPFNIKEVQAIEWIPITDLLNELIEDPKKYTPWFAPALEVALK